MSTATRSSPLDHPALAPRRGTMPAGRAIATLLLALLVASLLGADSLERVAERQPYGASRDVALFITKPMRSVSHALFLDRPREWIADVANRDEQPVASVLLPAASVAPTTTLASSGPSTTAPPPPIPRKRTPTAAHPLRVLFAGDSLVGNISQGVAKFIGDDARIDLHTDVQVGTGLARPDILDWGAELTQQLKRIGPDVVFLAFGGNDDQPLKDPTGQVHSLFTDGWAKEYARRVAAVMDLASAGGQRTVVWIGMPTERPERLNQAKDTFNDAARRNAAQRVDVHFADLLAFFGPAYSDTYTRPDGSVITARDTDGVHLTHDGANLLAPMLWQPIIPEYHLSGP